MIGSGALVGLPISFQHYDPGNGMSEVVAFEIWLDILLLTAGVVVVVTWASHRWGSSRSLSEEMGIGSTQAREEPWLKDIVRRDPPPPNQ